jgi:ubiquinone/menaquinone biosynthesis C-methylase UbiE
VKELEFRPDLYRGTGVDYDRFRLPYPQLLMADLLERIAASGQGRLLDLACGTGQISFAIGAHFAEVWAIDQEPDMLRVAGDKARATRAGNVRFFYSTAEALGAAEQTFELITVGNAFHRLRRDEVAAKALRWLRPGGHLALLWGGAPWPGEESWQRVLANALDRWMTRLDAHDRLPAGYEHERHQRPDVVVLQEAGFELVGSFEFPAMHEWTIQALIGFVYSTSILPRRVVGELADEFEEDLLTELGACQATGPLSQTITFAYDLARRAGP